MNCFKGYIQYDTQPTHRKQILVFFLFERSEKGCPRVIIASATLRLSTELFSVFMRAKYINNCIFMQKDKLRDFAAHSAFYKSLRLLTFFKRANKPSFAYYTVYYNYKSGNLT
jgi:hypothetical protein